MLFVLLVVVNLLNFRILLFLLVCLFVCLFVFYWFASFLFAALYNHSYLSQEPSTLSPSTATCTPSKHIEHTLLSSDYF